MKKMLIFMAFLTAVLACDPGCGQTFAASNESSMPVSDTASDAVPAPAPIKFPQPSYTLNRAAIPAEVNTAVMMQMPDALVPVTYGQVLDEAERQGKKGELINLSAYQLTLPQIKDLTVRCVNRKVMWLLNVDGVLVTPLLTSLDLSGHNLAGFGINLYEIFALLPDLTKVNICKTGFNNDYYAALQDTFPNIRMIWEIVWPYWTIRTDAVAFSTMKGSQPCRVGDEYAKYLKYCTDMVALDLGHNNVRDWSFVQYMPNLKILIAVDNAVSDLSWLKYTPKLEYLEFFVGRITDLSFLQYTQNMVDLNISYNRISDASYLYNLPKLERLWMEHTLIPYSEFQKLQNAYPNAKLVYNGAGSIDQGWRTHERYSAMRDMFLKNYVHELFMDKEEANSEIN